MRVSDVRSKERAYFWYRADFGRNFQLLVKFNLLGFEVLAESSFMSWERVVYLLELLFDLVQFVLAESHSLDIVEREGGWLELSARIDEPS